MHRRDSEAGFTLIETLVAFAIVALMLLPLLHSFSTGLAGTSRADAADGATLIAQSTIELLTPDAEAARLTDIDRQDGSYHITGRISPYVAGDIDDSTNLPLAPYRIAVTVSWPDGARTRSVAFDAIRLGPPPDTREGP